MIETIPEESQGNKTGQPSFRKSTYRVFLICLFSLAFDSLWPIWGVRFLPIHDYPQHLVSPGIRTPSELRSRESRFSHRGIAAATRVNNFPEVHPPTPRFLSLSQSVIRSQRTSAKRIGSS